ncbi:MAG: hypothetical protein WEB60_13640 [Terrimicrobiaceae bacterium]
MKTTSCLPPSKMDISFAKPLDRPLGFLAMMAMGLVFAVSSVNAQSGGQVTYSGKVMLKQNGRLVPFPGGRVGTSNESGRMTDSTEIQADGSYQLRLMPNERNYIQVLVRGYTFDPARVVFFASDNREIPAFIATPPPNGTVIGTMKLHPASEESIGVENGYLANQRFLVKNATTGQLISTLVPDGRNRFRYSAPEGTKVILEPKPNPGVSWTPSSQVVTLTRGTTNVEFQYLPASAVGVGNLNLAKDKQNIPDVVEPVVRLASLDGGEVLVESVMELTVASIKGSPFTSDMRFTFLYRFNTDTSWRTAANNQRKRSARFKITKPGHFYYKVVVFMNGAPMGSMEGAGSAQLDPTVHEPTKLEGVARMPGIGFIDPLPDATFFKIILQVDPEGPANQPQNVTTRVVMVEEDNRHTPRPRQGRRISFYVRHESDRNWRVVTNNARSMAWNWTPNRPGKWRLRVDMGAVPGEETWRDGKILEGHETVSRDEKDFVAFAGNTNSDGITSQTYEQAAEPQPTPRPFFRPFATPAPTPRPALRPVATPTPRQTFKPLPRPTPSAEPAPVKKAPVIFRPRPTPKDTGS